MMNKLSLSELAERIKKPQKTLVLCHKNPDPDTLGSAFALKHILCYFGSDVTVGCADETQKKFGFITGGASIAYNGEEYERYIAVDVASPGQLGDISHLSERVDITIDHHANATRFSDYFEKFTASCAEIIYLLARELGILEALDKNFYECLYAGMSADTGGFRFSNVTSETLSYASYVVSHGIDHAEINRIIFDSRSLEEVKAQRLTYENMEMHKDGKISIIVFTNEMKEKNGISDADIGDIVNTVRGIDGVIVALSLKQSSKDATRFSLSSRANCDIDVSRVCQKFGGGGHMRAAGATVVADTPNEAKQRVIGAFIEALNEYKMR